MNDSIFNNYRIWFVTGSQHLYGPETIERVAEDLHASSIFGTRLDHESYPPG